MTSRFFPPHLTLRTQHTNPNWNEFTLLTDSVNTADNLLLLCTLFWRSFILDTNSKLFCKEKKESVFSNLCVYTFILDLQFSLKASDNLVKHSINIPGLTLPHIQLQTLHLLLPTMENKVKLNVWRPAAYSVLLFHCRFFVYPSFFNLATLLDILNRKGEYLMILMHFSPSRSNHHITN